MANDEIFTAEDPYAPRRSKSGCTVFAIVFGAVAGAGVLLVACCGGLMYFGMDGVVAPQIVESVRDNPVVEEHVGAVREIDFVFGDSFTAGPDQYVIDVVGTKGRGRLRVEAVEAGDAYAVVSGTLETPDGERHDLFPDEEAAE